MSGTQVGKDMTSLNTLRITNRLIQPPELVVRCVRSKSLNQSVPEMEVVALQDADVRIHLYSPSTLIGVEEFTTTIEGAWNSYTSHTKLALPEDVLLVGKLGLMSLAVDDDENVPAATVRELPAHPLEGLWER